jgi:beta-N-acetylhexosaminidase
MTTGAVMLGVAGSELGEDDLRRLAHPLVGGVLLFTRNYRSPEQLTALTQAIHAIKSPPLLIAADHEGGRVQRFRDGFTLLPPMRALGRLWDQAPSSARDVAHQVGYVLAAELRAHGVDFSFTPVLDIDSGNSKVIGDRAFHGDPQTISELAYALLQGLRDAGMATVGKHFPGHGYVAADSHTDIPIDNRELADIEAADLVPFKQMIGHGMTAVMPAHVVYPKVDKESAGYSSVWLQDILRRRLGFDGAIFSDELLMEGARGAGSIVQRAQAALGAGCDMVLVCNNPPAMDELLATLQWATPPASEARLARMRGGAQPLNRSRLQLDGRYQTALHDLHTFMSSSAQLALEPDPTVPSG